MSDFLTSDSSRVWLLEGRGGPAVAPRLMGLAKAGTPNLPVGDVTTVRNPDPDRYGAFRRVGKIIGTPDDPTLPIIVRYTQDLSRLLRLVRNGCDHDVQVHIGDCQDLRDFNGGWNKILVIESARADGWTTDNDIGALSPDENNVVNEQTTFTGLDMYEIGKQSFVELATAQVTGEVIDIVVCDRVSCGSCGITSDGCDKVFAVSVAGTGSPSGLAGLLYSNDGGGTWGLADIDSMGAGDDPTALACVGSNLVVLSNDSASYHYAPTADILDGTDDWTEVATGVSGGLNAIVALGPANVWMVGDGGYIYFSDNIEDGVEVLTAGTVTSQNLNAIAAFDNLNLVAVGNSNVVLNSKDGGTTWSLITGPAVGVAITAVAMKTADIWIVGLANGAAYYTRDGGNSWTLKGLPSSPTRINKIVFASPTVGYMAITGTGTRGRVLRTVDGGNSWYVAPEGTSTLPLNDKVNSVAVCEDVNIVFAAGLGDNGTDGYIAKGSSTYA